jgi:small-conductance mechanosensitive channel
LTDSLITWMHDHGIHEQAVFGTIGILAFATIGGQAINRLSRLLSKMQPRFNFSPRTVVFFTRSLNSVMWICAFLLILEVWGFGVTGLWSILINAIAVIGVGFLAVWTIVSNITASLFITIWRPFHLDETVELLPENVKGQVVDRNLIFTALRENEGAIIQIPNNLFFQKIFRVVPNDDQYRFGFNEDRDKRVGGVGVSIPPSLRTVRPASSPVAKAPSAKTMRS